MKIEKPPLNRYEVAANRVKEIKGFYIHLTTYCKIILFLLFINYITFWEFKWFWFPLIGWGIGLVVHWLAIFVYGSEWEEKKILEIMEREKINKKNWK